MSSSRSTISRVTDDRLRTSAPQAALTLVYPAGRTWTCSLGEDEVLLGRETRATDDDRAPLADATISRRHARIALTADRRRHVIRDLDSRNGTSVDGIDLGDEPLVLEPGSVLRMGDAILIYERIAPVAEVAVSEDAVPGRATTMRILRAALARAAPDPAPVLLIGAPGTGKERIAREIHRLSGRRGPLIGVNCAALSPQLVESQLFGHEKGAFTGATDDHEGYFRAAGGGTLLLDEIGELPLEVQPKLLRAVQEGEVQSVGRTRPERVDVRLVTATNRDLEAEVDAGRFRRDLYGRLALWELRVPPLRERRRDLLDWLQRLALIWSERRGKRPRPIELTSDAALALLLYDWPDNLRGVDRLVHHLMATGAAEVSRDALPAWLTGTGPPGATGPAPQAEPGHDATATASADAAASTPRRAAPDRAEFLAAVEATGGNVRALARHFQRDRRQIYRWLDVHGARKKTDR